MKPRIETLPQKYLIGKRLVMSLSDNKTSELWRSFMPRRKEIQNTIGTPLYSLQVYDDGYFKDFNPNKPFEKWAAVEVMDINTVPGEMEALTLTGGLYAVFIHKGTSEDNSTFRFIFTTWLPESDCLLDDRPHFEVLGEKYRNNHPDSEEEIWIPVKLKT